MLYDDGDTEKLNLLEEKYEVLPGDALAHKSRLHRPARQPVVQKVDDGLEDSDVEVSEGSDAGSDFEASDESQENNDDPEDALKELLEDTDMSCSESEEETCVPRKRPAKQVQRPAKARKSAKLESPSENVDCSNGGGTKVLSPGVHRSRSIPEAHQTPQTLPQRTSGSTKTAQTPCTGQLHSRLSVATPGTAQTDGRSVLGMVLLGCPPCQGCQYASYWESYLSKDACNLIMGLQAAA